MCQSTRNPAAASSVTALAEATRELVEKMDRKGFLTEEKLAHYHALIADAEAAAGRLKANTVLYTVVLNDSGSEITQFESEGDRLAFLERQDPCGDDVYTLDVGPDRDVDLSLASVGEMA